MPSPSASLLAVASRLLVKRTLDAPQLDLPAVRRAMLARRLLPELLPRGLTVSPSRDPHLKGEWLVPVDVAPRRTLLFLHGGAFVGGSPKGHRSLAGWIAAHARARVISLEYSLAPEHPFPAALDDVVAAVRALYALGVDRHALGLVGDSAGAALALAGSLALRDAGEGLPAAMALLSPVTDMAGTGESVRRNAARDAVLSLRHQATFARMYAPQLPAEHPLVSPHYADLRGLPSMLIHASESEVLYDDARRLAERARAAHVAVEFTVWRDLGHDFHVSVPLTPESRVAVKGVGAYFARRVG